MVNTFWVICSYVVIVAHLIGEGRKEVRWLGDVLQELRKVKKHVPTPLLWMKIGYTNNCKEAWS